MQLAQISQLTVVCTWADAVPAAILICCPVLTQTSLLLFFYCNAVEYAH